MGPDPQHLITGVLVLGFDEPGEDLLEALRGRAKHFDRSLRCVVAGAASSLNVEAHVNSGINRLLDPATEATERVEIGTIVAVSYAAVVWR